MIVQVRGGSGSGKSWLVRELLRAQSPLTQPEPLVYRTAAGVYVLGRYDMEGASAGKGGEALEQKLGPDGAEKLLAQYSQLGIVVFETTKGMGRDRYARLAPVIWATLDTPADERISRIYQRRELTGRNLGKPLKEEFHRQRGDRDLQTAADPPLGVKSYWLDHHNPLPQLLWLLEQ